MSEEATTIVVGAGIIGASIAYNLVQRGCKPIVIERTGVACAASGKAGGFIAETWGSGPTERLHANAIGLHRELARTLGISSFREIKTMSVSPGRRRAAKLSSAPSWLDGNVVRCSSMDDTTAQVTPSELTHALMDRAVEGGAKLRFAGVAGVLTADGDSRRRIVGIVLDSGEAIHCDRVVFAMGPWTVAVEAWLGVTLPMVGIRSSSVHLKPERPLPDPCVVFCDEDQFGCHLEIYPRPDGSVFLCGLGGSPHISSAEIKRVLPDEVRPNLQRADTALRAFANISSIGEEFVSEGENAEDRVLRQACMRPCAPDALPIMGQIPGFANAFVATGHNCWGITWAPITGIAMAELMLNGAAETIQLDPFDIARFQ
eukprot:m.294174 g.294174  ORF g.294174 m.294174 type:complete len:373 (-) comp12938_c0_seq1:122-1240(-)